MWELWNWLQEAQRDPLTMALIGIGGVGLVVAVAGIRYGAVRVMKRLFVPKATHAQEKDAIAAAWADEADLIAFGLLKEKEGKGWMVWK